jgi:hypothetical protein
VPHRNLRADPPRQSLYVVRPEQFRLIFRTERSNGTVRHRRRCVFRYRGVEYDLSLTDPVVCARDEDRFPEPGRPPVELRLSCGDDLAICVSLAREFNGFHYKVVATIFEGKL